MRQTFLGSVELKKTPKSTQGRGALRRRIRRPSIRWLVADNPSPPSFCKKAIKEEERDHLFQPTCRYILPSTLYHRCSPNTHGQKSHGSEAQLPPLYVLSTAFALLLLLPMFAISAKFRKYPFQRFWYPVATIFATWGCFLFDLIFMRGPGNGPRWLDYHYITILILSLRKRNSLFGINGKGQREGDLWKERGSSGLLMLFSWAF